MIELFIICSCTTDNDINKIISGGETNISLNDVGKEQATKLVNYFTKYHNNIDLLISSNQSNAFETGDIIAKALNKQIYKESILDEKNLGIFNGVKETDLDNMENIVEPISSIDNKLREWLKLENKFYNKYTDQVDIALRFDKFVAKYSGFTGIESKTELKSRIKHLIDFILENQQDKKIIIVSHPLYIKNFLSYLMNACDLPIYIKAGSISYVRYDNNFKICLINDITHLE